MDPSLRVSTFNAQKGLALKEVKADAEKAAEWATPCTGSRRQQRRMAVTKTLSYSKVKPVAWP